MRFDESNEYYVVKGWFDSNGGINQGKFYGAVATPDNYLQPKRVVLTGEDASRASKIASSQKCVVYPEELMESTEYRADESWIDHVMGWADNYKDDGVVVYYDDGSKLFVSFGDWASGPDVKIKELASIVPSEFEIEWECESVPGDEYRVVSEIVSSAGVAAAPAPLFPPHMDKSRTGMPDRGGHGKIHNLGQKKVKTGKNIKGQGRNRIKGFGNRHEMPTISQTGGRRGGNKH